MSYLLCRWSLSVSLALAAEGQQLSPDDRPGTLSRRWDGRTDDCTVGWCAMYEEITSSYVLAYQFNSLC